MRTKMLVRGIDYYLVENSGVPLRDSRKVHLGRSASGWCFFLHVYPNRNILDWGNLLKYVKAKVRGVGPLRVQMK